MIHDSGGAHLGSCLSVADILAVLYADVLQPEDKVIFSKGHAAAAFYSVLARTGRLDPDLLRTYGKPGSKLTGCVNHEVPGVLLSTGSLGHGLPVACGMALADRKHRVFCIMSDGEMDCGTTWEAARFAAINHLTNVAAIIDANGWQACKRANEVGPWLLGWGHADADHDHHTLRAAMKSPLRGPLVHVCRNVKGRGVSFMEDDNLWHYRCPDKDEYIRAMRELECAEPS